MRQRKASLRGTRGTSIDYLQSGIAIVRSASSSRPDA
jgi:hypothetical protein